MHSGTLERAGSPRKRTLSRGVSEDESLRNIIKEAESSTRRLTRSDSRGDTLKRRSESQRSEEDLVMTLPEMLELQTSYDEVVQELRGLEVERETLWFQVDVLQDALEGAEEMLAEAQREASHASMELERERETKRKLEDMVSSLMQEVERLKEHRNTIPAVPVYTLVREQEREEEMGRQQGQEGNNKMKKEAQKQISDAPKDEGDSAQAAPLTIVRLDSVPLESQRSGSLMETNAGGLLASFFRKGRGEQPSDGDAHPPPLHDSRLGSSVDSDDAVEGSGEGAEDEGGPLTKLQKMVSKTFGQKPTLALGSQPPGGQAEDGRDSSPDRNNDTDSISAYEDASADTPEMEGVFPGSASDGLEMPDDASSPVDKDEEEYLTNNDQSIGNDPKSPDSCLLS